MIKTTVPPAPAPAAASLTLQKSWMVVVCQALQNSPLMPSSSRRFSVEKCVAAAILMSVAAVLLIFSVPNSRETALFDYDHDGGHSGAWSGTTNPPDLTDDQA